MSSVLSRVAVLVGMAGVLGGCLEMAVYDALQDDSRRERGIRYDEGRFDSEIFGSSGTSADPSAFTTPEETGESIDLRSASIEGDLGNVRGIHDEMPLLRGYSYGGYSSIDVHTSLEDGSGAAMAILAITGELDSPELVPGSHLEFGIDSIGAAGLVYVSLIGCSGPFEGSWEFDQSADRVELDVTEGTDEGTIVIDYQGTFQSWEDPSADPQVLVGSVELGTTVPAP